jgi:hypothetical protein
MRYMGEIERMSNYIREERQKKKNAKQARYWVSDMVWIQ